MRDTPTMDNPMDYKELMQDLIRDEVGERRSDLKRVKEVIINEIGKLRSNAQQSEDKTGEKRQYEKLSLSTIDNAYIDQKYIVCCLEFWVQEVASFLKDNHSKLSTGNLSHEIVQRLLSSIDTIQNLKQIPEPLNHLQYYSLLMNYHRLVDSNNEKTFIRKFKSICYEQIIAYGEFVRIEFDFLTAFVEFLLASKSIQEIIDELHLRSFCEGNLPFGQLIDGIRNLEVDVHEPEVIVLKETADCLNVEKEPFLAKTFKEIINTYIKPVEIQEKKLDGRLVLEVTGKSIIMSKIIHNLETRIFNNPDIEEVRIVGADVLHIDVNLKKEIWHGKNLVILAKIMKIHHEVIWDVSGKDSDHIYPDDAGTGEDGHGKRGADGYCGEAGGNVLIIEDEVRNPEDFTIISHGGKGSKGQDGGNGHDGEDGNGLSITEFQEKFPSVVLFLNNRLKRCHLFDQTVNNITQSSTITTKWQRDQDQFIEATTSQKNDVTFSYCSATPFTTCLQSFLLYKGSLGKQGGRGGANGSGGEGGYNGVVTTNNTYINVLCVRGKTGETGRGGLYGYHGRNAWDVGYADYQHWRKAEFYGIDQCAKLQVTYHDGVWGFVPKDSVWCPYNQKYAQITTVRKVEQTKKEKYQERTETRQNNALQHQVKATRKKTISQGQILADYSHCYSSIEQSALKNSQLTLDKIMERALQKMVENAEQQDKVTTEMKVRSVKSARREINMSRKRTTATKSSITSSRNTSKLEIRSLIDLLTGNAGLDVQYKKMKSEEWERSQLDKIFSVFETKKSRSSKNIQELDLEKLIHEKYRFAVLREIAKELTVDHVVDDRMVIPENASRYLIVATENDSNISHAVLGTLNQYLYENSKKQREQVHQFFNEKIRTGSDYESLKSSVGIFVLRVGKSEQVHPDVGKYYLEYKEFLRKHVQSLNIFLEPLCNELKRHEHLYSLWLERNNNQSARIKLCEEIWKDKFLTALYNRYNNQLKQTYDWTKCCKDEGFLKEYREHICERGPFSECYRELLSHVFDVNIKLYFKGQDNQFYMSDNHKPSSKQAIHILKRETELKQLNVDEDYFRLEEERTKIGRIYAKVLEETMDFNKKQQFDDYFDEKTFLINDIFENDSEYSYGSNSEEFEDMSKCGMKELTEEYTEDEILKRSVKAYILKVGELEKIPPEVKKYYNEFKEFSEDQKQSLNIYFEPFYRELKRYEHAFTLWTAKKNNESAKNELEKEIEKHHLLNVLYKRFDNQLQREYDWNECCENKRVLKAHEKYVRENGQLLESYSELIDYFTEEDSRLENDYANQDDRRTHIFAKNESVVEEQSNYSMETQTCCLDSNDSDNEYLVREEQDIEKIIKYFESPEERLHLKERLEKITSRYTGQHGILHYLSSRFSNDGRHLSFQELCYLVNSILTSVIQDRKEMIIYCWIVAAYLQNSWIDELVLLQLENYMEKPFPDRPKWRKYLSKVSNKDILLSLSLKLDQHKPNTRIPIQCIEDALYFLGYISNEAASLEGLDVREWPDVLKEKYWTKKLSGLTTWRNSDDLSKASYYLLAMENNFDNSLVEKFIEILSYKGVLPDVLIIILSNFYYEKWILSEEVLNTLSRNRIGKWVEKMERKFLVNQKERDVTQLVEIIQGNVNNSGDICDKLPEIEQSLRSIRNEQSATDHEQSSGTVKRIFNWFNGGPANTSEGTSNKLPTIENSGSTESKLTKFVRWIKNDANVANTSEGTSNRSQTSEDLIDHNIRKHLHETNEETADKMTESDIKIYSYTFRECLDSYRNPEKKKLFIEESCIPMLAVIGRAIELKRGFKLRDTQKLAILALLANDQRNTLAQVSTGEGKSLIVVAAAIIKAVCREKVDIITSSSVLARRDAEGNRDIYSLFYITVSHNCSEEIEKRRTAYSSGQVVYGDLSNFQRDYLLDRFYEKNILGDRDFENVFVDEVDSMLLDKGNNMLYLSHDLPGLDKLESLYVYIWQWVNRPAKSREDFSAIFDATAIREAVLNDLYGVIMIEDVKKLDSELDDQQATIIWERLIEAEILDDQGKMLREDIDDNKLETVLSPKFNEYENRLRYLLKECTDRKKMIHVPNYLKPFIEQHLEAWIDSAITAAVMREGHDYVMDVDRTGTSQDLNPRVTIVDRDTGTYQANSQWDEALHQYLQLKHGCKISLQSLKAVFISNVSYFKLYKKLYGVTGTLGSRRERDLLLEIHNVNFVTIPTAVPKQFFEEHPILCTEKTKWVDQIFAEAAEFTHNRKRSVLIICQTIEEAEALHRDFEGRGAQNIHTYTRDYVEFDIAQGTKKLEPGHIIIATNLSGRGTDIKITEELRNAGGLHVCLTYLPSNSRIEQQAFGRGARSGDKGSGRLIIMDSKGQEYSNLKILDLKKQRDAEELFRISDIKAYYETQIVAEEQYFEEFQEQYRKLSQKLTDEKVCVEAKRIVMQCYLDKWAFWLDSNSKCIENLADEKDRNILNNSLKEFISQINNLTDKEMDTWVEGQPVQMINLGKHFCQVKKYDDAIKLFDKVIELEPYFSEAAHYYKAFALFHNIDWGKKPLFKQSLSELKIELREARRLFTEHSQFAMCAAGIIDTMKEHNKQSIVQVDSYQEQQKSFSNLYNIFAKSIDAIFDQPITPKSFVNGNIDAELSEIIYEDLLSNHILKNPTVKRKISEEVCEKISFDYGISIEDLKDCLAMLKGGVMDEKEFMKTFKTSIQLPSREDFWKLLIEQDILNQEVKCIVIDVETLKKVDPLFSRLLHNKINNKELTQETLEHNHPNVFILNTEQAGPRKDCIILEKRAFKELLATDEKKYEFLKKKAVFKSNKKAYIDLSNIASTSLPRYDSITLQDFSKENIAIDDAEQILAGLVAQKVLKKLNSESDTYRLIIPTDQIQLIKFAAYPVYRIAVIGLLSLRFIYRIALERIEKQLEKKSVLADKRLLNKPHHHLIHELIDQNVIRPVTFNTEIKDLEGKLKGIYSRTLTKDKFTSMLSESRLIPEEHNTDEFRKHLVKQEWLFVEDAEPDVPKSDPLYAVLVEMNSAFDPQYSINDSEKRQELTLHKDVEKTIEKIFDNRLKLSKEDTIKHIVRVLEKSRSRLNVSEMLNSNLKPLTECYGLDGSKYIEEINVLSLNGLDKTLRMEAQKWSANMLFSTAIVIVFGVIQIVTGIVIDICSSAFTIAASFISEGIGDIIFGFNVLRSGYFSWTDYILHKVRSLMLTVCTCSLTAFLRRVANARFGSRVAGLTPDIGENVAQTTSSQLLESAAARGVVMAAEKQTISRTISMAGRDLAHGGVDVIVKDFLRTLCDGISSAFLSTIKKKIEERNIPTSLGAIYKMLGKEEAMKFVADLAASFFNEQRLTEKYLPIAFKTADSATQGIENAVTEMSQSRTTRYTSLGEIINATISLVPKVEDLVDVGSVRNITGSLLNNLEKKLTHTLRRNESAENSRQNTLDKNEEDLQACERFKTESINQWNLLVDEQMERMMRQHIVRPILNEGAGCLIGYCNKIIRNGYRSGRVTRNNYEIPEDLRQQYQERQRYGNGSVPDPVTEVQYYALHEYHNNLNTLAAKKGNSKLLAAIVRENVPLDVTCLNACTKVISKVLGIGGLTIIARGKDSARQRFSFSVDGVADQHVIQLELIDNRFQLHGSIVSERNSNGERKNHFLYEAVSGYINLNMTREDFRSAVADCIEHDPDVQHDIKKGWNSCPTSSVFGSRRESKVSIDKPCTNSIVEETQCSHHSTMTFKLRVAKQRAANRRSRSVERAFSIKRQPGRRNSTCI